MPAYSFKERFVPMVLDGSKPHTIRNRRKHPARVGDPVYLFYGMRTKFCRRLRAATCLKTCSIFIHPVGSVFLFNGLLAAPNFTSNGLERMEAIWKIEIMNFIDVDGNPIGCRKLSAFEKERLAWLDGFRPDGTSHDNPYGSFGFMWRYWRAENSLPYLGDIIYWSLDYEPATTI